MDENAEKISSPEAVKKRARWNETIRIHALTIVSFLAWDGEFDSS
jgi:hypothetical protein